MPIVTDSSWFWPSVIPCVIYGAATSGTNMQSNSGQFEAAPLLIYCFWAQSYCGPLRSPDKAQVYSYRPINGTVIPLPDEKCPSKNFHLQPHVKTASSGSAAVQAIKSWLGSTLFRLVFFFHGMAGIDTSRSVGQRLFADSLEIRQK